MIDDLRQQASDADFFEGAGDDFVFEEEIPYAPKRQGFLGMTPGQRLIIAMMLLLLTCIISTLCLLVTGRVVLPPL